MDSGVKSEGFKNIKASINKYLRYIPISFLYCTMCYLPNQYSLQSIDDDVAGSDDATHDSEAGIMYVQHSN